MEAGGVGDAAAATAAAPAPAGRVLSGALVERRYEGDVGNEVRKLIILKVTNRLAASDSEGHGGGGSGGSGGMASSSLLSLLREWVPTIPQVRVMATKRLYRWLQSPALSDEARLLLNAIPEATGGGGGGGVSGEGGGEDLEVINMLVNMRLRANQVSCPASANPYGGFPSTPPYLSPLCARSLAHSTAFYRCPSMSTPSWPCSGRLPRLRSPSCCGTFSPFCSTLT